MKKNKFLLISLLLIPFVLSACSLSVKTKPSSPNSGVYKSTDSGIIWELKSSVLRIGAEPVTIANHSINFLEMDPIDINTIYAGTREKGLYVSYDSANSWRHLLSEKSQIVDVVIDPVSSCNIYAVTAKTVYKTVDCGRKWRAVFYEKRKNASIIDISIDNYDSSRLYLSYKTGSNGEIFTSSDYGESWQVIKSDFKSGMKGLYINPKDTRIMYAATEKRLFRTSDRGITWEDLTKIFKEAGMKNGQIVSDMVFLPQYDDGIISVSKYGLLLSEDSGQNWQSYILLQQPNSVQILSFVVNLENTDEMYYGTAKGIYRTVDGGENWITLKPPTTKNIKALLMDPEKTNSIYIGAWAPPEK